MKARKVGIYSGSFDPIHLGHITFALQAIEQAGLDKVYFLPERAPQGKFIYEHFGHRVAMIKTSIKPHSKLALLELDNKTFSVNKTLPALERIFKNSKLVFLFGSDKVAGLMDWPNASRLFDSSEIVIGLREGSSAKSIEIDCKDWPKQPTKVIESYNPTLLSTEIRQSLQSGQAAKGLAKSVATYIRQNWLYISIS